MRGQGVKNPTESKNGETALSNNYMTAPQQKKKKETTIASPLPTARLADCPGATMTSSRHATRLLSDGSFALSPLMLVKRSSLLLLSAKVLESAPRLQVAGVTGLCVRDFGRLCRPCLFTANSHINLRRLGSTQRAMVTLYVLLNNKEQKRKSATEF